jgi:NAD(P)-dependent dehydrogenase (short-subunit alcohol dehydrogenase family)
MADGPMQDRIVLVTGATSGIGLETSRQLAANGASLVLGVRDAGRGAEVARRIVEAGGQAEVLPIDLASFASVREAAARFAATHDRLDVLVNNAGIALPRRELSIDGHELTWQTNFLSHVLLTRLLLPGLARGSKPRIVSVSSEGHRRGRIAWYNLELERGYGGFQAYANSKLAQILFTRELARREPSITVNALHPGAIATNIWRLQSRPLRTVMVVPLFLLRNLLPSPAKGAAPVARLASDPSLDGVTGRYFKRFREATPSAAGSNDADAARLWRVAAEAVDLTPDRVAG